MTIKSTAEKYGSVAVFIHWLTAIMILAALSLGFLASGAEAPGLKITVLRFHALAGGIVLFLTLLRMFWWTLIDKKPRGVEGTPAWRRRFAVAIHLLFYVAILALTSLGILMLIQSGAYTTLFFGGETKLPDFWQYGWRLPHGLLARILLLLVFIHITGAVIYAFMKRNSYLSRIWF